MKIRALALDYDGTIAQDGMLNPQVRAAIPKCGVRADLRSCS